MKKLPIVALIGQTNAGKSSLLNRLARRNIAIVAREAGTTRDNVMARIDDRFLLIDTAGLKDPEDNFEANIQDQINDAIDAADVILLTLDSSKYPDQRDTAIARSALKSKKPVLLLLNKSDLGESLSEVEFINLGFKDAETFRVSATTGQGIKELKATILGLLRGGEHSARSRSELFATNGEQPKRSSTHNDGLEQAGSEKKDGRHHLMLRHKTIKKVTTDLHRQSFNTAVAALMEYVNELYKTPIVDVEDIVALAKLLKPFAPHLASEMLEHLGAGDVWPTWDEKYLVSDEIEIVVQVNGKLRARLSVAADKAGDADELQKLALEDGNVQKFVSDREIRKVIIPKGAKLINIVV